VITLTAIGDEISQDLDAQLDLLESEGMKYVELRSVWNKNVLDLTEEEIKKLKENLDKRHFKVAGISSPIGKIKITDDFDSHLKRFEHTIRLSNFFQTRYVRIFGYYLPESENHTKYREEVIRRMKIKTGLARKNNLILLLENEYTTIYGSTPEEVLDVLTAINSPSLRFLFDPGNYVYFFQKRPYPEMYNTLADFIEYIHVKDVKLNSEKFLVCGDGDVQFREIFQELQDRNYKGFISLEPHLALGDSKGGFSGKDNFIQASRALKKITNTIWE